MSGEYIDRGIKILHLVSGITESDGMTSPVLGEEEMIFEKMVARDVMAFRELLQRQVPDVILLDHTAEFNHSSSVLEFLHRNNIDLPVILLIDSASEEEALKLFTGGVDDYVFLDRPARLATCIRKIIKKYYFIRERERLENKLIQNERKFRSLIENSSDGIIILDPDGSNSYISPSVKRILDYSEVEAREINFYSLVHPMDQQLVEEGVQACFEMPGLPLFGLPIRIKTKNGSYCWLEITFTNLINDPTVCGLVVNFRDISQYKKAEFAIRENEEKYRSFFENSLDGILLTVTDGQILAANPAVCSMLGMTENEICRVGRFGIVDSSDVRVGKALKERQEKGHVKAEVTFVRKDGSKFPAEVTSSVFTTALGEKRTSMIVRDLSEKKKAEEEKEAVLQELRETSIKLLTAQRIAKLGYWEMDLENEDIFWTEEVYRIWGRNRERFSPALSKLSQTIHPDDRNKFASANTAAMAGIKKIDLQHRIILPDGSLKWVHERGSLSITLSGKKVLKGTVQDITESKLSLEKLVTSEARIRGILKSQTNYLIRIDLEGKYSYCNDKFYQDFNRVFEDGIIIGKEALSSVKESSHEKVKEVFYKCIASPNKVYQVEIEKKNNSLDEKYTIWDLICLTSTDGNPVEIQGVGVDFTERVKAERSLLKLNQRYELVTKATSDAIYDWDIETGKVLWSESYSDIFGYSKDSTPVNAEVCTSRLHPEDRFIIDDLNKVLDGTANSWQTEYRYLKADGDYAHVLRKDSIIRNNKGEAIRMVGAVQDITERKQTLQKLERSEARHRGILKSQTSYLIRTDMEGKYSYCNDKFLHEFGWLYEGQKIIGQDSLSSIMEYHHERIIDVCQKCVAQPGEGFQVELDKPGKNNSIKTTLWDMVFLKDSGIHGEIQCMGIDISDRVKAEKENRFQANLLDKIGQAVIATDPEGKITYWNKAAKEIYGWSKEEVLGNNLLQISPAENSREQVQAIKEELSKGRGWSGELWVKRKNGNTFPASITSSPFYSESGELEGVIGISSDITERKLADDRMLRMNQNLRNYTTELVAANKGLEQFSYIVSHNLRAPVANILGLGELINTEEYPAELKEKLLKEIVSNIERLDSIIKDLNDILQVKVHTSEKKEKINLENLVETISSGIRHIVQKEGVKIYTDFSEVSEFCTTKSYLHSIFSNLLVNSIKYRRPDVEPVIEIRSKRKAEVIQIEFSDNGLGIDLGKRGSQVFGLYKRFHSHVEGKGMGLFMVKTQVEIMGGKIQVFSEVDKGTRFLLEFKEEDQNVTKEDEGKKTLHVS